MPDHVALEAVKTGAEAVKATVDGTVAAATGAGGIGITGVFVWMWKRINRVFDHTIPRLAQSHKETVDAIVTEIKEALREQRAFDREEMRSTRADFKEALKEDRSDMRASLEKLSTAVERLDQSIRTQGK